MEAHDQESADESRGQQKPICPPRPYEVVVPPDEVSLLATGAVLGGIFGLALGVLIGARVCK